MFNFNNPPQAKDIKAYYKNFYYQNKLLVYLMGINLLLLIISGARFFDVIYFVYLIYFGGVILKQYFGDQKVLTSYLFSGLIGVILFGISYSDQALSTLLISSFIGSAALGLLSAAATYIPNMEIMLVFFGRVKLKWVAMVLIALDILTMLSTKSGENISHLGGVIYGFLSIYILKSGRIQNPFKDMFKHKKTKFTHHTNQTYQRPETDEAYLERKQKEQKEIDVILDKIKQKGYESLSASEKQKLFDKSKRG